MKRPTNTTKNNSAKNTENNPAKKPRLNQNKSKANLGTKQVVTTSTEVKRYYFDIGEVPTEVLREIFSRCCTTATSIYTLIKVSKYLNALINQYIEETLTLNCNLKSFFHPFEQELLPDFENANYETAIIFYQYSLYNPRNPACARFKKIFECKLNNYIDLWSDNRFKFSKSDDTYQLSIAQDKTLNFSINNNDELFILQKFLQSYFKSSILLQENNPSTLDKLTELIDFISNYHKKVFFNLINDLILYLYQQFENPSNNYSHLRFCFSLVSANLVSAAVGVEIGNFIIKKLKDCKSIALCCKFVALLIAILETKLIKELNDEDINFLKDFAFTKLSDPQVTKDIHPHIFKLIATLVLAKLINLNEKEITFLENFEFKRFSEPQIQIPYFNNGLVLFMLLLERNLIKLDDQSINFLKNLAVWKLNDIEAKESHVPSLLFLIKLIEKKLVKLNDQDTTILKDFAFTKLKDLQAQEYYAQSCLLLFQLIDLNLTELNKEEINFLENYDFKKFNKHPKTSSYYNGLALFKLLIKRNLIKRDCRKFFCITNLKKPQMQIQHTIALQFLIEQLIKNQLELDDEETIFLKDFAMANLKDSNQTQTSHTLNLSLLGLLIKKKLVKLTDLDTDSTSFLKNFVFMKLQQTEFHKYKFSYLLVATLIAKKEELFTLVSLELFENMHNFLISSTNADADANKITVDSFSYFLSHPDEKIRIKASEIYVMLGGVLPKID